MEKTLLDNSFVYSLNNSLMNPNILFSGGSDSKIKVWNIQTGKFEKEIVGHRSPVSEMILFENPFDS